MSLPPQTIIRLPKIKQGLKEGLNHDQIGANCGVTEKTIDRDMQTWVESGGFETWLKTEFVELYFYEKTANPSEAFKELCHIVGRMVTQKRKVDIDNKITEELTIDLSKISDADKEALDNAARILESQSKRELNSIH